MIEDDPLIRNELDTLLQSNGYETAAPEDFDNVIDQIKAEQPHLILLDIKLPGTSGFSLCTQIRTFSQVPIIFVTSCNTDMDELNSIMLGGDAFITKPYHTAILLAKIASLLKRAYPVGKAEGGVLPAIMAGLLILFLAVPALFKASTEGPGSMHAPVVAALLIALVVGALAQRARLCMAGGLRDVFLFRDFKLLYGFVAIFVVVLVGNLINGTFKLGFTLQPVAHSSHVWNFLGMALVGWGSVLLGGCPLRQLILAGEGNGDSAVTVLGMMAGAAISHNFGLAGNADALNEAGEIVVGGISTAGKIAVILGFAVCLAVSLMNLPGKEEKA